MAERVSRENVAALAKKLNDWGRSLPKEEQAVLDLIVSKGEALQPESIRVERTRAELADAVLSVFQDVRAELGGKEAWARIDPIWYKSGALPNGEEVEITAKIRVTDQ